MGMKEIFLSNSLYYVTGEVESFPLVLSSLQTTSKYVALRETTFFHIVLSKKY